MRLDSIHTARSLSLPHMLTHAWMFPSKGRRASGFSSQQKLLATYLIPECVGSWVLRVRLAPAASGDLPKPSCLTPREAELEEQLTQLTAQLSQRHAEFTAQAVQLSRWDDQVAALTAQLSQQVVQQAADLGERELIRTLASLLSN